MNIKFKTLTAMLLCASLLAGFTACNEKKDESSSKQPHETTLTTIETQTASTAAPSETKPQEVEALKTRIAQLEALLGVEYKDGEYIGDIDIGDNAIHEIYDDTAVVNAYLTNDSSALTDSKDIELLEMAKAVAAEIITENMSPYEKELAVHDWISSNVEYDTGSMAAIPAASQYAHTPYGVLKYKSAICVGFATTFKLFMDMFEIENKLIHATKSTEHAWNLVCLDNEWYHVDVTFDNQLNEEMNYSNFNVTDEVALNSFYWENDEFPKANGTKYNYCVQNGVELDDVYKLPTVLKEGRDNGKGIFYFNLIGTYSYESLEGIAQIITYADTNLYASASTPIHYDGKTAFSLTIEDYSVDPDPDDPDDPDDTHYDNIDMNIMDELISDLF